MAISSAKNIYDNMVAIKSKIVHNVINGVEGVGSAELRARVDSLSLTEKAAIILFINRDNEALALLQGNAFVEVVALLTELENLIPTF